MENQTPALNAKRLQLHAIISGHVHLTNSL